MGHFVLLTRIDPTTSRDGKAYQVLSEEVVGRIERECPDVTWTANYAILGPYDYLDIFEASSLEVAARVSMIVRSKGHVTTEIWGAIPQPEFTALLKNTMDEVEEADLESFPASDAPAWTGTTATRSDRDD